MSVFESYRVASDDLANGGYGYTYNAAGRMASMSIDGVAQAEYKYNALGQQVVRRLTQLGQTIHSVHDLAGNRIAEYLHDETLQTSSLLREYVWLEDRPVAVIEGGQMYFIRTDHIGRPVFATNDLGVKMWEASYLPFGGVHTSSGPNAELRFPGQWFQLESGLHQNWMREYDPTTGRYIQADPLGLVDGASVYGYALQNPGRYIDPTGEFVPQLGMVLGGIVIGFTIDMIWGDGCYTLEDAFMDGALGLVGGHLFKGFGKALGAVKRSGNTVVRTTRSGDKAIRTTRPDGSIKDISPNRVKEYKPNTHPNAPPGSLTRVKYDNALSGSKGYKRAPIQQELDTLRRAK